MPILLKSREVFTTIPLKPQSVQNVEDNVDFLSSKEFNSDYFAIVSEAKNVQVIIIEKP